MGEDALALVLWDLEVNQKPIPAPSDPAEISAPEDTGIAYITTDTAPVHRLNESRSIRKNVTILLWLDTLAREHNINFSNFLQNALMKELHVAASHT